MEHFFSKRLYCFRKGCSTKNGKWILAVDKGKYFCALLTDFSKALDFISPKLVLAELHAYMKELRFIHSYLNNRKQITGVNGFIVPRKKSCLEFHKELYLDLCFLIYFFVTFS